MLAGLPRSFIISDFKAAGDISLMIYRWEYTAVGLGGFGGRRSAVRGVFLPHSSVSHSSGYEKNLFCYRREACHQEACQPEACQERAACPLEPEVCRGQEACHRKDNRLRRHRPYPPYRPYLSLFREAVRFQAR